MGWLHLPHLTRATSGPAASVAAAAVSAAMAGALSACAAATPVVRASSRPVTAPPAARMPPGQAQAPPNVYAHTAAGMMNRKWAADPYRVYVPNSLSDTLTVINPRTYRVIATFGVGASPNHVTPSWDGSVLWVNNTDGNSLTPVNPKTGRPGRPVPVEDPYNLYFTPDGRFAVVMAEARSRIDFRDPRTMALRASVPVPCAGVNHLDFTADGRHAVASCEFSGQVLWIDIAARKVLRSLRLGMPMSAPARAPGRGYSMPQDVRLSPDGRVFYVADMAADGVWLIGARRFAKAGFIPTGAGAHGLEVSRGARYLFVSNRGEGSISVLNFATRKIVHKWRIPGGGSPDMGGISPDGKVMWWGGRYSGVVYAMSASTGRLLAKIPVGAGPHGVCVFPQPGRYSLGHTGNFR